MPLRDRALEVSCRNGHLEVVKWIYSLGNITNIKSAMYEACAGGHIEIAKWLHSIGILYQFCETDYVFGGIYNRRIINGARNHIEILEWLHGLGVDFSNDSIFLSSCIQGNIDIAKWLVSIGADIDRSFYGYGCIIVGRDQFHKWLQNIDDIYKMTPFTESCAHGRFELAKWLHEIGANTNNRVALMAACYSNFEIAKWLIELHPNLLAEDLFDIKVDFLKYINIPGETINVIESIKLHNQLPEMEDIDDIVVHALAHNNNIELLKILSDKFPFISYESDEQHTICSINRSKIKNARNI